MPVVDTCNIPNPESRGDFHLGRYAPTGGHDYFMYQRRGVGVGCSSPESVIGSEADENGSALQQNSVTENKEDILLSNEEECPHDEVSSSSLTLTNGTLLESGTKRKPSMNIDVTDQEVKCKGAVGGSMVNVSPPPLRLRWFETMFQENRN